MTEFFNRMREFGFRRLILSYDFLITIALFFIVILLTKDMALNQEVIKDLLSDVSNAAITIATIILAGFAIIVSFTDNGFIALLKKIKVYSNIIFVFEYTTLNAITCFLLAMFLKYLFFNVYVFYLLIFLFIYLLLSLMSLIMFISFYGVKRSEYLDKISSK